MQTGRAPARERVSDLRADWRHPTEIRFGVGRVAELPDACGRLGVRHPLLVTDPGLAWLPTPARLVAANLARGIETGVFSGISSDPDGESIADGARIFLEGEYDGIIALGGGSCMDAGKAIGLALAVGAEKIWEFALCQGAQSPQVRKGLIPPIIAIPTTAGTGAEVSGSAVITDAKNQVKRSLFYPDLLPDIVIADPILTRRLSPSLTAATGMDALSHNLEALCSPGFSPMLDAIALQGIRYVKEWLPVAYHERRNIQARVYSMAAAIMGAIAFDKGLGAMHAMAHAVGALFKTHHGRTIAAVMPYVLRFNQRRIKGKMEEVAHFLALPRHDYRGVVNWLLTLRMELGMPATLGELGVTMEEIPALVERTLADANAATNPVPLDPRGVERLFRWAIRGEV
jgi:alcohol dehydrogenase class IV